MTQWGIDALFNPGKRHMDEEKRRLQATREEVGDSSGGRRIDLESGKMRISRTGKAAEPDGSADDATAKAAAAGADSVQSGEAEVKAEPKTAAERAAARRAAAL